MNKLFSLCCIICLSLAFFSNSYANSASEIYDVKVAASLDEIAEKIRTYKQENPLATDEQLDNYAENLLANNVDRNFVYYMERSSGGNSYELDGYLMGYLNDEEKKLYSESKAKSLLCIANGKLAVEIAKRRYVSGLYNGNGDAFRHALWNFGMTKDVGAEFAKRWSDAHEYGAKGQPKIEQIMDLHNNKVGISLANSTKVSSISEMSDIVQKQVRTGNMRVIVNGKLVKSNSAGEKR